MHAHLWLETVIADLLEAIVAYKFYISSSQVLLNNIAWLPIHVSGIKCVKIQQYLWHLGILLSCVGIILRI